MKKLIGVINKLQDVFNTVGIKQNKIDLPQIAVVGVQSAGKSSVLENIVGYDILPRGNNVVTRRPLVLQLVHTPGKPMVAEMLDQYLEAKKIKYKKRFTTYDGIRKEVEFVTDKAVPDSGKNIISDPIRIRLYSPEVIDLTLVDLPGITKIPIGDQPKNIEHITIGMAEKYISKKNCIILAISAANVDIANSEAIKLAKKWDPRGERTVGVLTKLDLMDEGTNAMDVLLGKIVHLKKGFIGIVNRSQHDIKTKKSIKDALKFEEKYFASHSEYKSIAHKCGIPYLSKRLNSILLDHIRIVLPDLKRKIDTLITHARDALIRYGSSLEFDEDDDGDFRAFLLELITKFSQDYQDCIEGKNVDEGQKKIFGGARINRIFYSKFLPGLKELEPSKNLTDKDIQLRIKIAKGAKSTLYIPEHAFEILVKMQVDRLKVPSLRCCEQVLQELVSIVNHCLKSLSRFPTLQEKMREFAIVLLKKYNTPLKKHIKNMIKCELAYINTNHPDFFGGGTKVISIMEQLRGSPRAQNNNPIQQRMKSQGKPEFMESNTNPLGGSKGQGSGGSKKGGRGNNRKEAFENLYNYNPGKKESHAPPQVRQPRANIQGSDREIMEVAVIRTLLEQYFKIVRKQIGDSVPKAIMHFLVNMSCKNLHAELIRQVYTQDPNKMLKESDEIKTKRKTTKKLLGILLNAKEILNEIHDYDL